MARGRLGPSTASSMRVCAADDEGENRGIMTFDYDSDGDLDVLIINHGERPKLYRNVRIDFMSKYK